jgi:hypothetical protein
MDSKVVGGFDSELLTGVDGRAGVELFDVIGVDFRGTGGMDIRTWLLSVATPAELEREPGGNEY